MQLNNNNSTHSKVTLFLDFILFNELFFHQKNPDEENRKKKPDQIIGKETIFSTKTNAKHNLINRTGRGMIR